MNINKLTKILLAASTVAGVAVFALVLNVHAARPADYGLVEGWTISAAGTNDPDIYIVNDAGYKRLFLNPAIFNFYGHLGGFANVHNVSAATRDAFPTSGIFRNCETNDAKVYGVETTGEDTGMLHWVNVTGDQAVAQDPNFFAKVFCINNNEFNWYAKGSDYSSVNQIPNYVRTPGATPVPTGNVSASLSSTNPVAGTIVNGQSRYDLAEFMFTGSGTVTNVQLKRIGVSADATLTNVYLFDGTKRLTDSATVSNGVISFNDAGGLFTVSGSKVISVVSDISGSAGETVGVQLTGANGNSFALSGNIHTLATATLATVAMSATTTPSTDGAPTPATDFVAWQNSATVGVRYVWLKSVQFRVVGSVAVGDIQNFRLYSDGVQVGSAVGQTDANGYVVFDVSGSPVKLETGSRTLKVLVDIVNGSGKNFYLSLRQKSDIWTVDSQYSASVLATGTFPVSSTAQNIASGTLTITRDNASASGDVVRGASGIQLARFQFKATGEKMKVENLRISNTSSPLLALRNGALFADDGMGGAMVQIGSTQTIWNDLSPAASSSAAYTEFSLGSSLIVDPLHPRNVEIRGDIFDASGTDNTAAGNTIVANIVAGSSNVQRLTTLDYPAVPYSAKLGNTLTIRTGSLTAGKFTGYANQTVVAPKQAVKLGHYTLVAASSEDVSMNTLTFDLATTGGTLTSDFTDAYVKVWNDTGALVLTTSTKSTLSATASNSYSVNFVLPKNKTYQLELWANVASSFASGVDIVTTNFDAAGITTGSSTTATATQVTGQVITSSSGSLTKANGSIPSATLAKGGDTKNAYAFTLTPAFDDYYLDEVYVDIPASPTASQSGAVSSLILRDGSGNQIGSAVLNSSTGSASFTGLNQFLSSTGGTKTFKVDVVLANVGVGANDTAGSVTIRLDGYKTRNGAGVSSTSNGFATTFGGNAIIDVAGYPVFANQALGSSVLSTGAKDIFQSNISAVGNAALKRIIFSVTTSNGPIIGTVGANNLTNGTYKIFKDGVDITSLGTIATGSADLHATAAARTGAVAFTFTNDEALDSTGHVYKLQVNVTATGATPESIVTQISNNSTTASAPDDSANTTLVPTVPLTSSPSVVWTDSSAVAHASTTDDYMNDYLVKTINVSQSVSF